MHQKYYAEQFRTRLAHGENKDKIIADLQLQFLTEASEMIKAKKVKNDLFVIAVLKYQTKKWFDLSKIVPDIPPLGFIFGIFMDIPEMYKAAEVMGFLEMLEKQRIELQEAT